MLHQRIAAGQRNTCAHICTGVLPPLGPTSTDSECWVRCHVDIGPDSPISKVYFTGQREPQSGWTHCIALDTHRYRVVGGDRTMFLADMYIWQMAHRNGVVPDDRMEHLAYTAPLDQIMECMQVLRSVEF